MTNHGLGPMPVPRSVAEAVAGWPMIGTWDVMIPVLTVDDGGYPHVCLLSRAELDADDRHIYAVFIGPTTIGNVRRTGRATLLTVEAEAATSTKLDVASAHDNNGWLVVTFTVAAHKHDGIGIPLRPPGYLVAADLPMREHWERTAALLNRARR